VIDVHAEKALERRPTRHSVKDRFKTPNGGMKDGREKMPRRIDRGILPAG
jgi:hypothetical protein